MTRLQLWMAALLCGFAMAQDDAPKEPLCRAAQDGDVAQVRAFLAGGANPNARDETGQTPLMWAASLQAKLAAEHAKGIERDYEGVVRHLLDKGADVNARDKAGRTALLLAMEGSASEYKVIGADESM